MVQTRAGRGTVPRTEAALLERGDAALAERLRETVARDEVAEHRVAAVPVDAHIDFAAGDGIEAAQRRIAIDRVHLVRRVVAQQALARVLVGVIAGGEQQVVADPALEVERGARGGVGLAVVPAARPGIELTLEPVAVARSADQCLVAEVDDALDEACGDHVAHLWHEAHDTGGLTATSGDSHHDILCLGGREQFETRDAVGDGQLHTRYGAISVAATRAGLVRARVGQQHAARGMLECGVAASDGLAIGVEQTHHEFDGALTVGGHTVAIGLDDDAAHGADTEDARRERIARLARQQQRIAWQHRRVGGRGGGAGIGGVGVREREDRRDGGGDGHRVARQVTACHGRLASARRQGSRVRLPSAGPVRSRDLHFRSAAPGRPVAPSRVRGSRLGRGGPSPGR